MRWSMVGLLLIALIDGNAFLSLSAAGDWPGWRGPRRDGLSTQSNWRTDWALNPAGRLWMRRIGTGYATVAVVEGRVYTVGEDLLYCLDAASGDVVWQQPCGRANATPTVNGTRVFTYSNEGVLSCFDTADGRLHWQRDPRKDMGAAGPGRYGYAASPLAVRNLLLVPIRFSRDAGALVAFDTASGTETWRFAHAMHAAFPFWSSPVLGMIDGSETLVWLPGRDVVGLKPTDGCLLWEYKFSESAGFTRIPTGDTAATPVIWKDRVLAHHHPSYAEMRGYKENTFCIEIKAGAASLVWQRSEDTMCWFHTPVVLDGYAYAGRETHRARLHCYNLDDGNVEWTAYWYIADGRFHRPTPDTVDGRPERPRPVAGGPLHIEPSGSFMIAGNRLISWGNFERYLAVIEVSPKGYRVLAHTEIDEAGKWVVPLLLDDRLYCRTDSGVLICLDVRNEQVPARANPGYDSPSIRGRTPWLAPIP